MSFQPPLPAFLAAHGRVCTLGMFIIDHFEVRDEGGQPVPIDEEAIGGGGVHGKVNPSPESGWAAHGSVAMVAARLFLPPSSCALLVDRGNDFPQDFAAELGSFGEEMLWYRQRDGKTTRALNVYSGRVVGEGHQTFQYLSPQLHLSLKDLIIPPSPFATPHHPEWVHIVVRIPRARELVSEMRTIEREGVSGVGKGWRASMIWEPLDIKPGRGKEELEAWLELAPSFAAISPNLVELQTILSLPVSETPSAADVVYAADRFHLLLTERRAEKVEKVPVVVLRAGSMGSYTISEKWRGWVPAFWGKEEQNRVVDPTGGGNAFLGGLCAGLLVSGGNWRTACVYASTAASFAIEQRGLPKIINSSQGERWNGDVVWARLQDMARRVDDLERHAA